MKAEAEAAEANEEQEEQYFPIILESLVINYLMNFEMYIRMDERYVLYRGLRLPFRDQDRDRLVSNKVKELYVPEAYRKEYFSYLESHMKILIDDKEVPSDKKANIIYSASTNLVQDVLDDPNTSENIKRTKNLVGSTVNYVVKDKGALYNMMKMSSHDYYTYTHSVHVCTFAVALARFMGLDPVDMNDIGVGSLLHDIGKAGIDPNIITKNGPLNDEEWKIMQSHPTVGVDILREGGHKLSKETISIVHQHHEKMDGSGYPQGLKGEDIHPFGRIACLADCFDAMTTNRSYQKARPPFEVLKILQDECLHHYDKDVFAAFIKLLGS